MTRNLLFFAFLMVAMGGIAPVAVPPTAANGVAYIEGCRSWQVIAPSFRPDKEHIRLILGNEAAVRASSEGRRPFPDGAIFAKIAWSSRPHPDFSAAVIPGSFVQVEFMIKDSDKFKATGGWGFARFVGKDLQPYGKDAGFARECFSCHEPEVGNDFVFTIWAETR